MRIDFDAYIAERTRNYSPRPWIFARVGAWLTSPAASRFFVITAEPGGGKTAIAAQICNVSRGVIAPSADVPIAPGSIAAHHFCSSQDATWIDPLEFSHSISAQLGAWDRAFERAQLESQPELQHITANATFSGTVAESGSEVVGNQLIVQTGSAQLTFTREVRAPLKKLFADDKFDRDVVILVDALDEALLAGTGDTIIDLIALWKSSPPRVRFLLTCRPEPPILRVLEEQDAQLDRVALSEGVEREESKSDVRRYVSTALPKTAGVVSKLASEVTADAIADELSTKADGNFLWAQFAMSMLSTATPPIALTTLDTLPKGLHRLYREFMARVAKRDPVRWEKEHATILGTLVAAQEEMTVEQLAKYSRLDGAAVARVLNDLRQLLDERDGDEPRYSLYHKSLADFLLDPKASQQFQCDELAQHRRIVEVWAGSHTDAYALRNIAAHLFALRADAKAREALYGLVSQEWMNAKRMLLGNDAGFANDVAIAAETASERREDFVTEIRATSILTAIRSRAVALPAETLVLLARLGDLARTRTYLSLPNTPAAKLKAIIEIARAIVDERPADAEELLRNAIAAAPSETKSNTARALRARALAQLGTFDDVVPLVVAAADEAWEEVTRIVFFAAKADRFDIVEQLFALERNENAFYELLRANEFDVAMQIATKLRPDRIKEVERARMEKLVVDGDIEGARAIVARLPELQSNFEYAVDEHADAETIVSVATNVRYVVDDVSRKRSLDVIHEVLEKLGERADPDVRVSSAEQLIERGEVEAAIAIAGEEKTRLEDSLEGLIAKRDTASVQKLALALGGHFVTRAVIALLEAGDIEGARPLLREITSVEEDEAFEIVDLLGDADEAPPIVKKAAPAARAITFVGTVTDPLQLLEEAAKKWKLADAVAATTAPEVEDLLRSLRNHQNLAIRIQAQELLHENADWDRERLAEQWSAHGHVEDALRITSMIADDWRRISIRANVLAAGGKWIEGESDETIERAARRLIELDRFDAAFEFASHLPPGLARYVAEKFAEKGQLNRAIKLVSKQTSSWRRDSELSRIISEAASHGHRVQVSTTMLIDDPSQRTEAVAAITRAAIIAGEFPQGVRLPQTSAVGQSIRALTVVAEGFAEAGRADDARWTLDLALNLVDAVEDDWARNSAIQHLVAEMTRLGATVDALGPAELIPHGDRYRVWAFLAIARQQARAGDRAGAFDTVQRAGAPEENAELAAMIASLSNGKAFREIVAKIDLIPVLIELTEQVAAEPWWIARPKFPPSRWLARWKRRRRARWLAGKLKQRAYPEYAAPIAVQWALLGKKRDALRLADQALAGAQSSPPSRDRILTIATAARVYAIVGQRERALPLAMQAIDALADLGDELETIPQALSKLLAALDAPDEAIDGLIRAAMHVSTSWDALPILRIAVDSIERNVERAARIGTTFARASSECMPQLVRPLCDGLVACAEIAKDPSFLGEAFSLASRLEPKDAADALPHAARRIAEMRDGSSMQWINAALRAIDAHGDAESTAPRRATISVALLHIDENQKAREQITTALRESRNATRMTFFEVLSQIIAGADEKLVRSIGAAIVETEQWWKHRSEARR